MTTSTSRGASDRAGSQWVHYAVWVGAVSIAVTLGWLRYNGALVVVGDDFRTFRRAAAFVHDGHSPYDEPQYPYSPLLAFLMAPFADVREIIAWRAWIVLTIISLQVAALLCGWSQALPRRRFPIFFAVAAVTSLSFWPTTLELFLGQVQWVTLLAIAASTVAGARHHDVLAGVLAGAAGVVKTWPAPIIASYLRRPRSLVAAVLTLLAAPALAFATGSGRQMVDRTIELREQPWVRHSIWGIAEVLFTASGKAEPLWVSRPLYLVAVGAGLALVAGLAVLALRRESPIAGLALWHLTMLVVLVLPVSHATYAILALPILWLWFARLLHGHRDRLTLIMVASMFVWWLVVRRPWPDDGASPDVSAVAMAVVGLANLAAVTASIVVASLVSVPPQDRTGVAAGEPA